MRIGFLGLGTMGEPIANNLRKSGHEVTVWNRTPSKADHIVSKGGKLAKTPKECAAGKDLVFTCVSDEKALAAVLGGPEGALAGLAKGGLLVDMSTAGPKAARAAGEGAAKAGAGFLACPILGSKTAAEQAQLVLVAGGSAASRDRARAALRAVSARIIELDDPAQAALVKLCVNVVGGAMIAGFSEAVALGASGGLDPKTVLDVLQASPFHSPLYLVKFDLIDRKDFSPRFAVSLAEKDQRLASEAAAEQGAKVSVIDAVRALLAETAKSGRGDRDVAAVAELLLGQGKRA